MEQIILNLVPGGVSPVCYVSQYDVGRKIRLHLRNGSDPYVLSGAETVTATIRKVSGEELIYDIVNTSASYVDLIVNYDATDVIGESVCELIITESGLRIGSANFKMRVDPDVYSGDQKLEVVTASSPDSLLSFETNIDENLLELKTAFEPIQDLHGYPSPWIDSNEVNKEPYIKRAVAGTATRIGNHLYDKLVGGTVAFNQLNSAAHDTTYTATPATSEGGLYYANIGSVINNGNAISDHIYLVSAEVKNASANFAQAMLFCGTASSVTVLPNSRNEMIKKANNVSLNILRIYGTASIETSADLTVNAFDLTAMFGSTIADYIYSLEQATAGAGVAFFKALFPNDYYAYNAGELMSVKATAHIMRNASNTVIGNYALDSNLELRGLFKLDTNNKLYADGDTYESSGNVTRKYGVVDLGSINWIYVNDGIYPYMRTQAAISDAKKPNDNNTIANIISVFVATYAINIRVHGAQGVALDDGGFLRIATSNMGIDPAAFKTTMSGVYLVYEKATPTTEQASPFTNPQVCDENGTEEYTDSRSVAIPVGHETYQANICPISGFTEANITRRGVNLWDEEWEVGTFIGSTINSKNFIKVAPTSSIYLKTPQAIVIVQYDVDKTELSRMVRPSNSVYTLGNSTEYIKFYLSSDYGTTYNNDVSINYPSTDTTYHAYNGQTYAIAFGQTVYGGVLDVTRGKLHVTWVAVDLSVLDLVGGEGKIKVSCGMDGNLWRVESQSTSPMYPTDNSYQVGMCDQLTFITSYSDSNNNTIGFARANATLIIVRNDACTTAAQIVDFLNQIQVVYPLATPFDIDLTPVQINAIVGVNNLMHDANGGTEVKFFRLIPAS